MRVKAKAAQLISTPFANAENAIGVIEPGCRVVGLTKGQFSLIDLIEAVLAQINKEGAELLVSTWTPGKTEIERVAQMLDACTISRFRLLVDRSFVTRHAEYVEKVCASLGDEAIRQTRTHAKFALIAAGDYRIAIRTSMNFNRNPRFEQFDLDDDAEIYGFFDEAAKELYETVPAGLNASRSEIERGFKNAVIGNNIRMPRELESTNDVGWSNEKAAMQKLMGKFNGGA